MQNVLTENRQVSHVPTITPLGNVRSNSAKQLHRSNVDRSVFIIKGLVRENKTNAGVVIWAEGELIRQCQDVR